MDLEHGLATVPVAVHDDAVAVLGQAFLLRVRGRGQREAADDFGLSRLQVVERGHVHLGHEQHVHRRLRGDVAEGDEVLVLMDDIGGQFAPDDLVEDGGHRYRHLLQRCRRW